MQYCSGVQKRAMSLRADISGIVWCLQVAKILATEVIRLVEKSGGGLTTLLDLISLQPSEEKRVPAFPPTPGFNKSTYAPG